VKEPYTRDGSGNDPFKGSGSTLLGSCQTLPITSSIELTCGQKPTRFLMREIWRGKKPTVKYFRVFGSKCYILRDRENLRKFDPKSDEGIFLG
jgi:hypothetical protein